MENVYKTKKTSGASTNHRLKKKISSLRKMVFLNMVNGIEDEDDENNKGHYKFPLAILKMFIAVVYLPLKLELGSTNILIYEYILDQERLDFRFVCLSFTKKDSRKGTGLG